MLGTVFIMLYHQNMVWLMEMPLEVGLDATAVPFVVYHGFQDPVLWFINIIICKHSYCEFLCLIRIFFIFKGCYNQLF